MTKQEAIEWAGGTIVALAKKLDITHGAIHQWDGNTVPELQQYRLHRMSAGHLALDKQYAVTASAKGK